jgi:pseudaminic acid synthase
MSKDAREIENTEIEIGGRRIGLLHPVFVIAELSANHNQNFDLAVRTIEAMKKAGADAVKLQTYTPDSITIDCDNEYFRINQGTVWDGKTLYQLYQEAYTPWEWQPKLKEIAEGLGLIFFSTPFDESAVDFLEALEAPAYKVASFEITDIPLIEHMASKGKPVIISTGIATREDIEGALEACRRKGNNRLALLKCTSAYPAPLEEVNLSTIPDMAAAFGTVVGLSDHTQGISVPAAAVALGARIVEKHFILDRSLGGPDAAFSLEPREFEMMARTAREAQRALGAVTYDLSGKIRKSREFSRSLFAVRDICKGEIFTPENVRSIRPGFGLPPKLLSSVLGKRAGRDISKGTPMSMDMLEG